MTRNNTTADAGHSAAPHHQSSMREHNKCTGAAALMSCRPTSHTQPSQAETGFKLSLQYVCIFTQGKSGEFSECCVKNVHPYFS